jgi:hypothetical protein
MDKRYKHLNGEERGVILADYRRGAEPWGDRAIAGVPHLDHRAGTASGPSGGRPCPAVLRAA